ncbi:protein-L-isoaspartate O-methyltransferase [Longimycelium tulufanense]|uniref:Protein-L-isoaspartate O-methyltransferase n=1 Tax=Longimycelium tulufanense TaxID=907463 RepID=A0A8J3CCI3_9PSEU|nr:hypothetical protein [Longimycelium tulufanense]GGM48869.1 protein-L-isoaspartate O-methyltransferase [Longimycelium tulufanense]
MDHSTSDVHGHRYQEELVHRLRALGAIRSPEVESAFRSVPRHLALSRFLQVTPDHSVSLVAVPRSSPASEDLLRTVYEDTVLVTHVSAEDHLPVSSSSRPSVMAMMLEELLLGSRMSVLEIGAGTGYNAALLGRIVGPAGTVTSVEVDQEIGEAASAALLRLGAGNAEVVIADGFLGHPPAAPYDRIVATVGVSGIPPQWTSQLRAGGLVLAPVLHGGLYPLMTFRDTGSNRLVGRPLACSGFVPAAGRLHPHPRPWNQWSVEQGPEPLSGSSLPGPLTALDESRFQDLWFALGVLAPGQVQQVTLLSPQGPLDGMGLVDRGERVFLTPDGLWSGGDGELVDLLASLVTEWVELGRPRVSDWGCGLEPDGALLVPAGWQVTR